MTYTINEKFEVMNDFDLQYVDGGTFWGVVGGAAQIVGGIGAAVVCAGLALTPEPTGITKYGAYSSGALAGALVIGGIATIGNNL